MSDYEEARHQVFVLKARNAYLEAQFQHCGEQEKEWHRKVDHLKEERDKLKSDISEMVKKAADNKLDGYRELGARAAAAENERDEVAVQNGRLREALLYSHEYLNENQLNSIGHGSKAHREMRAAIEETPAASLANVRAEAIEEAVKACMPGPCNPPDDPPQGYQEYCEGVASVKQYADAIRQSASQSGGEDA